MIQSIRDLLRSWRYSPENHARDLRLDLIRGYLIAVMTIDHFGTFPAWTRSFTGGGKLWVSAAEGFILISGFVLGMLYRRRARERGWHWSVSKIGRRAVQLYLVGVVGQILLSTGDYLLRLFCDRPSPLPTDYLSLVKSALYQTDFIFSGVDLLPLYALLLPYGLLLVYLLARGQWKWVVILTVFIWYTKHVDPNRFSLLHDWFPFNLWQLPFGIGVVTGYYREQILDWLASLPGPLAAWSALLIGSSALMLFVSYQVTFHGWFAEISWMRSTGPLFMRTPLSLGRVMVGVWVLAALYHLTTLIWGTLRPLLGWLLLPLGQDALTAYVVQGVLVYIVARLPGHPFPGHDPTIMGFLHIGGLLMVWSATRTIKRISNKIRPWKTTAMQLDSKEGGRI